MRGLSHDLWHSSLLPCFGVRGTEVYPFVKTEVAVVITGSLTTPWPNPSGTLVSRTVSSGDEL